MARNLIGSVLKIQRITKPYLKSVIVKPNLKYKQPFKLFI